MALPKAYGIALGWPMAPGQLPPPVGIPPNALTSAINGQVLTSATNGAILTSAIGA
jgi:hypothetical protein